MILEIYASLVIQTSNIKEANVNLVSNTSVSNFTPGESLIQREQREREELDRRKRLDERLYRYGVGANRKVVAREKTTRTSRGSVSQTNPYKYGYCTYWVAQQKGITQNFGDAKYWPTNSQTPKESAVIVTYENKRYGHVGEVIKVIDSETITIREMNYVGWNKISERTVKYKTLPLKGFLII